MFAMAKRVITTLIDDVDGKTADETITFALDGSTYEIDLSEKNAKKMRDTLGPWVENARRVSGRAKSTSRRPSTAGSVSGADRKRYLAQVREWAGSNGVAVPGRGRIPADVLRQYDEAAAG